ncbi:MAG TPA: hypothetical protein VFT98_16150 [Myxococcota bacterium]|nr:hypothetical protein [Myxococcota bacterium]
MERGRNQCLPVLREVYRARWYARLTPEFWFCLALFAICAAPFAWVALGK